MKAFKCQHCTNVLYFENTLCGACGRSVGYDPESELLVAVTPNRGDRTIEDGHAEPRFCGNWEKHACNWLVGSKSGGQYCLSCQHNVTIPDVSDPKQHALWVKMETAKRRLFYSLIKLGLPRPLPGADCAEPLMFEFLAESGGRRVITGHDNGKITIALSEADDVEREKLRVKMHEPYRTLLGHFRHEIGHFYWDVLVRDSDRIEECREIFGDDLVDYEARKQGYYEHGPDLNWRDGYISAYATMHPWEDFAETWAHYLHIIDTLETAVEFGLTVRTEVSGVSRDLCEPYWPINIDSLMTQWLPITFAVNSLNRSMGQPDLYPFVVSPGVIRKLDFIRKLTNRVI